MHRFMCRRFIQRRALVAVLFFLAALGAMAQANNRFALIIGNSDYRNIWKLPNPVNDARDIAASLKRLGWDVDQPSNLRNVDMGRAISGFMQKLRANRDSEGFFWYAGHGVEIDKENYLLPVDIENDEDAARYSSIRLKDLMSQFEDAGNKVNVVIIDACRDNPFPPKPAGRQRGGTRSRGLVTVYHPQDMFLMYSTAPGETANDGEGKQNSPFAEAFLKHIANKESLVDMVTRVVKETGLLTNGIQRPYHVGSFGIPGYSLAVSGVVPPPEWPMPDGFVRIQGGDFLMGSPPTEAGRLDDETQHRVTVSSFYMGKYEVTVGEFRRFVNAAGYTTTAESSGGGYVWTDGEWQWKADANWKNPYFSQGENQPVVLVSWYDAVRYCNWLSGQEGLSPAYTINGENVSWNRSANGYRLPTEAEWEYACRAGTPTPFSTGNNITTSQANYNGNYPYNNNSKGTYREKTTNVGSLGYNAWGLYDMHGNVWEWCWDRYDKDYSGGVQTDSTAASGSVRVLRGGSWNRYAQGLRSANRGYNSPSNRGSVYGFRVVRP
ncbi:hypothetical protein FACS1894137_00710 [Spirochaetia bacterium]|nr:hypothetical protein FACS1894137_00710 [Spirochaetia bacterium]